MYLPRSPPAQCVELNSKHCPEGCTKSPWLEDANVGSCSRPKSWICLPLEFVAYNYHFPLAWEVLNFCANCDSVECLVTWKRTHTSKSSVLTLEICLGVSANSALTVSRAIKLGPVYYLFIGKQLFKIGPCHLRYLHFVNYKVKKCIVTEEYCDYNVYICMF